MARHPRWVNALIAAVILAASLASVPAAPEGQGISLGPPTPESVVLLVIGCGALFWRRTHPTKGFRTQWRSKRLESSAAA